METSENKPQNKPENKIEVQLVRSVIGTPKWMRTIVRTMGLRKLGDRVVFTDQKSIRGMVLKVQHLVVLRKIEEKKRAS